MKLSVLLSPGIWDLLERLRPHLDLSLDLFDTSLTPLVPSRDDALGGALRELARTASESPAGERLQTALRTGQHQVLSVSNHTVAAFPLRHGRRQVGLLTVASLVPGARDAARLERLGWSLRSTIEADMATNERLGDEERRSRWLATTLRFFEHLDECATTSELFSGIIDGAAIWADVDARVYRRGLNGDYELAAALPQVLEREREARFPASLISEHSGASRVTSIAELEQFGWQAGLGEVLLLPVSDPEPAGHVIAVGGIVDEGFERVFSVAARTLARRLTVLAAERAGALRERLAHRLADGRLRFPAPATALLGDVAEATGATQARILVRESASDPGPRVLAAIGGSPLGPLPAEFPSSHVLDPDRLLLALRVHPGVPAWLELRGIGTRRFTRADAALAAVSAGSLEAWLAGAFQVISRTLPAIPGAEGFEGRIQEEIERARRFNLEAGLLVIDTVADPGAVAARAPLVQALRSQLRSSDVIGRLSSGDLAALLVQTDARGVEAVAGRVQQRLTTLTEETGVPPPLLGKAAYPSAGATAAALVTAARDDLSRYVPPRTARVPGSK